MGEESLETERRSTVRRFAVIGDPISHSRSPALHRAAYKALGVDDAEYHAVRVQDTEFRAFADAVLPTLDGVSVTMPHKVHAHELAARHDQYAHLGVCNTLIPVSGPRGARTEWAGYNTDVYGIRAAFAGAGVRQAESAAIFGSGATALSLATALLEMGCRRFTICARNPRKAQNLAEFIHGYGDGHTSVALGDWEKPAASCDTEILASALSAPGAAVVAERLRFQELAAIPRAVFDVVYHPSPTPLGAWLTALSDAVGADEAPGFATGAHMLAHQAAKQVELMLDVEYAPADLMYAAAFTAE